MKKLRGVFSLIIAYACLAVVVYGVIIFYNNGGFVPPIGENFQVEVELFFGFKLTLLAVGIISIVALVLAILYGRSSNKKLSERRRENAFLFILYLLSWIPYSPLAIVLLPFKLFGKFWDKDWSAIVFCILSYVCLGVGIYLFIVVSNSGVKGYEDTVLIDVLFGWQLSGGTIITILTVLMVVFVISTTIAHYKFKEIWDYSIVNKIFNVFTWIIFVPIIIAFLPISFIVWCVSLNEGSSSGSSSSSSSSYSSSSYGGSSDSSSSTPSYDYSVIDGGYTRYLTKYDYKYDNYYDSPYFGRYYIRCRDDLGNYWRSYDDGSTFMKETYEQTSRGY